MSGDLLKNWDIQEGGALKYDQAVDVGVGAVNPHFVVVRLDYVTSQEELDRFHKSGERSHRVQIAMSPETAIALSGHLLQYAKGLQSTVPTRDRQN
jgi:hypothetical protein